VVLRHAGKTPQEAAAQQVIAYLEAKGLLA